MSCLHHSSAHGLSPGAWCQCSCSSAETSAAELEVGACSSAFAQMESMLQSLPKADCETCFKCNQAS